MENKLAPNFALINQDGEKVSLSKLTEEYVVLFFYPKDNTPGCTIEAKGFSADKRLFSAIGAIAFGISGGDQKSKEAFCKKAGLNINLLSDPDGKIASKYQAYGEKTFMGRKSVGFMRKTYIIGPDRKIIKAYDKVKPLGHSKEVLAQIKSHKKAQA